VRTLTVIFFFKEHPHWKQTDTENAIIRQIESTSEILLQKSQMTLFQSPQSVILYERG